MFNYCLASFDTNRHHFSRFYITCIGQLMGLWAQGFFTGPRCLWGPVYGSRCTSVQELCETLLMWLWLMMIPTQYWLMKPIGQFGIDGGQWSLRWWWSSKLVWRCPMWAMRSLRGSARWCKSCRECWTLEQCDYVGDNIGCWAIG